MGNQVVFQKIINCPEIFGYGQAKQVVSLYHSNYIYRIDVIMDKNLLRTAILIIFMKKNILW